VTAREQQLQALVGEGARGHRFVLNGLGKLEQARLCGERAIAADAIDRAIARRRDQPSAWCRRKALARPTLGGCGEGFLSCFLGEVEVAEEADQRRQDATPLVCKDALEDR
jgi:hypothetical protein